MDKLQTQWLTTCLVQVGLLSGAQCPEIEPVFQERKGAQTRRKECVELT